MLNETPHIRPAISSVYRHKKRGTLYTIINHGTLQLNQSDQDDALCVIYRNVVDDGKIWIRPITEFMDGRFEFVESKSDENTI